MRNTQDAGSKVCEEIRRSAELEIVKHTLACFHQGGHFIRHSALSGYFMWKRRAFFDSFKVRHDDSDKLEVETVALFTGVDSDRDGLINANELRLIFPQLDEKTALNLLTEADSDEDAMISLSELWYLIQSVAQLEDPRKPFVEPASFRIDVVLSTATRIRKSKDGLLSFSTVGGIFPLLNIQPPAPQLKLDPRSPLHNLVIPDTIVVRSGQAASWVFSSADESGAIKRKQQKNVTASNIYAALTKQGKSNAQGRRNETKLSELLAS